MKHMTDRNSAREAEDYKEKRLTGWTAVCVEWRKLWQHSGTADAAIAGRVGSIFCDQSRRRAGFVAFANGRSILRLSPTPQHGGIV